MGNEMFVRAIAFFGMIGGGLISAEESTPLMPLWQRTPQPMEIRLKESFFKHHAATLNSFSSLARDIRKCTLRVIQDDEQVALATALTSSGFVTTKFSELDEDKPISCETWDGNLLSAKLTDTSDEWDLALLKLDAELIPITSMNSSSPELGAFLVSVDVADRPFSIGAVSVLPRALRRGFLGIVMEKQPDKDGVMIKQVSDNSAASEAGLQSGDIVLSVNGETTNDLIQLSAMIGNQRPGDTVELNIQRGDERLQINATLGERSFDLRNSRNGNRAVGIPISKKKTGFPRVLQHDLFIYPHQCGGPLVDLNGQFVGINIARYDRVTSYAIPADEFPTLLDRDDDGHVRFARALETIESDLSAAQAAVTKSMRELEENMQRHKELLEEVKRAQGRTNN